MNQHREMQLWVQSDNPDYQKAVEEKLAELRAKGPAESEKRRVEREWREAEGIRLAEEKKKEAKRRKIEREVLKELKAAGEAEELKVYQVKLKARRKRRVKMREDARAFAVRLAQSENREQFKRDLFDGLLSAIPREKSGVVLCAEPPKETGHLSDSQFWNGYEWERD
jgi:hypothetical protein